jgi:hypothetical protein
MLEELGTVWNGLLQPTTGEASHEISIATPKSVTPTLIHSCRSPFCSAQSGSKRAIGNCDGVRCRGDKSSVLCHKQIGKHFANDHPL